MRADMAAPIQIARRVRFAAGARYWLDCLDEASNRACFGRRAGPNGTGHDYMVEAALAGPVDPATGMVVNIADLKELLRERVEQPLQGRMLTEHHPLLAGRPPLPECLARALAREVDAAVRERGWPARLVRLKVAPTRSWWAEWVRKGEEEMLTVTRTYEFAAAHRLDSPELAPEENRALFGKCNNPAGHGHNYLLEVTVGGTPDPQTGRLVDLDALDRTVHEQVVDRYDHRHLNLDLPEFQSLIPSSENVVRVIWDRLSAALPPGTLRRVVLHETERNLFTCEGA